LLLLLCLTCVVFAGLGQRSAEAWHFSWDQGHDGFLWWFYNFMNEWFPWIGEKRAAAICEALYKMGCPVFVGDGNLQLNVLDLRIPCLGPDLVVARTYNSFNSTPGLDPNLAQDGGPFGRGWTFTYGRRLIPVEGFPAGSKPLAPIEPERWVIVRRADGMLYHFYQEADGTYTTSPFVKKTLTHDGEQYVLSDPSGSSEVYDETGRLLHIRDRNGNQCTAAYDGQGRLDSVADANDRKLTFAYSSDGKITTITDFTGRAWKYKYKKGGYLNTVADPMGNTTTYEYDAQGLLSTIADPLGNTVMEIAHDDEGRVTTCTDHTGTNTYAYNYYAENVTRRQAADGGSTTYKVDPNSGAVLEETDPLGHATARSFNPDGTPAAFTNGLGLTTTYERDALGNLTALITPMGHKGSFSYQAGTRWVTATTDPNGHTARYTYDGKGNLLTTTDATGRTTTYAYHDNGLVKSVADPSGHTTTFGYDANGYLLSSADPLGRKYAYTYDDRGNVLTVKRPNGATTTFQYDDLDRLASVTDANGNTTGYAYDKAGRLTDVTDAAGGKTHFDYDGYGRLIARTNALGHAWTYEYDAKGRQVRATDPLGNALTYSYDWADRMTSSYDGRGSTSFTYDDADRLISRSDGYQFEYDDDGRRTRAANSDSDLTMTYDASGRLLRVDSATVYNSPAYAIIYKYDAAGRRTSMTNPQGGKTTYKYSPRGLLTSLTDPAGHTITFAYDELGRRTSMKPVLAGAAPNFVSTSYTYHKQSGALASITHACNLSKSDRVLSYTYDSVGNVRSITDGSTRYEYGYDKLYQLTSAAHSGPDNVLPNERYTYDAVGNRLTSHLSTAYGYNEADQLLEDDQFTYQYDGNGNLVQKNAKSDGAATRYEYDRFNRLTQVTLPDGSACTYRYDAFGRRIEKNVGGTLTRYAYDGLDIVCEYDGDNVCVARYTHGPGIDEPVIMTRDGKPHTYQADHLGTILALCNPADGVASERRTDSFGRIVVGNGITGNPYSFTGREYDPASGLHYYRARQYAGEVGRFLQVDPVEDGANPYAYLGNMPVIWRDPLGLCREAPDGALPPPPFGEQQLSFWGRLWQEPVSIPESLGGMLAWVEGWITGDRFLQDVALAQMANAYGKPTEVDIGAGLGAGAAAGAIMVAPALAVKGVAWAKTGSLAAERAAIILMLHYHLVTGGGQPLQFSRYYIQQAFQAVRTFVGGP